MSISTATTDDPARTAEPQTVWPVTALRDWLDHLAARDRLAIIRPGVSLRFELAAIAKRLDGRKATFFAAPGAHAMPVISGLVSDRDWQAGAMGHSGDRGL